MRDECRAPERVREYLWALRFVLSLEAMGPYIRSRHEWIQESIQESRVIHDYKNMGSMGQLYEALRQSIHSAMRVCQKRDSSLPNDKTRMACDAQGFTDWPVVRPTRTGFMPATQSTVVRAFGMSTGTWARWVDVNAEEACIRHYDVSIVVLLTWNEGHDRVCVRKASVIPGRTVNQLQMRLKGNSGFRTETACFDE